MTTKSNDSRWDRLAGEARAIQPPQVDVRANVRAALERNRNEQDNSLIEAVYELFRLRQIRFGVSASLALAIVILLINFSAYQQIAYNPLLVAIETGVDALLISP